MCFTLTNCTGWLMSASVTCLCLAPSVWYLMLSLLIGLVRRKTQTGMSCGGRYSCWHFRGNVAFNVWVLFYWRSWHWQETEMLPIETPRCWLLKGFGLFPQIHLVNMKLFLIKIDVVFQTTQKLYEPVPISHHHSLFHFSPFSTTSLSFLLPLHYYCCTREVIFRAHLIV